MAVTAATLAGLRRMRVELDATVDATTRALAQSWSAAWAEITDEWAAAIDDLIATGDGEWPTRTQVLRAKRAQKVLQAATDAVEDLSREAGVRILRDASALTAQAAAWVEALATASLPTGMALDWSRVDAGAINAIVKRTTGQVHSALRPLSAEAEAAMKSSLIRGVAVGDNPRQAAARMLARVGGDFNGGRWRAENIARTEMLDAHRASARASRMANRDVLKGWRWTAELSSRTCPACLSMHGTEYPASEPGPIGHQSCRCTATPLTKGWADLGFTDIPEPADDFIDAQTWFNSLPEKDQVQIMGRRRLDALNSGDLAWADLATVRKNPGWRDSVVTAPLPAA